MGQFNDMYYCHECDKFTNDIFHVGDFAICSECIDKKAKEKKPKKIKRK